MEKIKDKIIPSGEIGIVHASRRDVRTLGMVINMLIDKVNELIDEVEKQKKTNQAVDQNTLNKGL